MWVLYYGGEDHLMQALVWQLSKRGDEYICF